MKSLAAVLAPLAPCLLLAVLAVPALAPAPAGADESANEDVSAALAFISEADLMATVGMLAAPQHWGRLAGSPEYDLVAQEMADRFAALGLEPGGDDGTYFQQFPIEYNRIIDPCPRLIVHAGASRGHELWPAREFVCRGFTGSGSFTAPVVFCGYGISAPEHDYDDYASVDVTGKLVLAFKQLPPWIEGREQEQAWGRPHAPRVKARVAAEHGAIGLLLVSRPGAEKTQGLIGSVAHGPGVQDEDFPQLHMMPAAADEILSTIGTTLLEMQESIDADRKPHSRTTPASVRLVVNAEYVPDQPTANVVAILRGSDPDLADEYLVLGAHLDHVGGHAREFYFPGANDNASGSAAVLEIADAFVKGGLQPRRSIAFVLFSAEEQGIFGARHYASAPAVPLEQTVAMFNFDSVGSGDSLRAGSGKSSPQLWEIVRKLDADADGARILSEDTWSGGGADATPFHEAGVPTLYFAGKNGYQHLHLTTDTPGTLNRTLFTEGVRLAFRTALEVTQGRYAREELVTGDEVSW